MKMSQLSLCGIIRIFVCVQILVLFFGGGAPLLSANPPVPVLTLDAGGGTLAEFSDYGLSNYGFVNGEYRGSFCFTVKNTSQRTSPSLPVYLVGMGLVADSTVPRFLLSPAYVAPGNFFALPQTDVNDSITVDAFIGAKNFLNNELLDGPTDGLGTGETLSVCMPLASATPFTLTELISRFTVLFSDRIEACYVLDTYPVSPSYSMVAVTSFGENEFGFRVSNLSTNIVGEPVTGFGFDLPRRSDLSLLSIAPSPQPGSQNFWFSTARRDLKLNPPDTRRKLDFGLLTGPGIAEGLPTSGIPPQQSSSVFRIGGDFGGLTTRDILTTGLIAVSDGWLENTTGCITDPTGSAVRGTVATNPR